MVLAPHKNIKARPVKQDQDGDAAEGDVASE
jgi:hypothetical protein